MKHLVDFVVVVGGVACDLERWHQLSDPPKFLTPGDSRLPADHRATV